MRARCRRCYCFNRNFITDTIEITSEPFCGLHGRERIDPDGEQPDFLHDEDGGCGFIPNEQEYHEQLTLF